MGVGTRDYMRDDGKKKPVFVHEATTDELMREIARRALACVMVVVTLESESGGLADKWHAIVEGSPFLVEELTVLAGRAASKHNGVST